MFRYSHRARIGQSLLGLKVFKSRLLLAVEVEAQAELLHLVQQRAAVVAVLAGAGVLSPSMRLCLEPLNP
jgi:hypothetical protein